MINQEKGSNSKIQKIVCREKFFFSEFIIKLFSCRIKF